MNAISHANRILVVTKFRYLGDTIVATPFLRQLRNASPNAEIVLLTGPGIPSLLQGCPYIADIWVANPNEKNRWRTTRKLVERIRNHRFDAAFLLNRSLHSAFVAAAARVPMRIGFNTEYRGPLLTVKAPYARSAKEIDCCLDLLRCLDIDAHYAVPELWVAEEEKRKARSLLPEEGGDGEQRPLILFQPGAKDPYKKQWQTERYAVVVDAVAALCPNHHYAAIGAEEEKPVCERLASLASANIVNLAGKTSMREVLALISNADILIGNDTAMVHAAAALGASTVTIQGPQTAAKWGYDPPLHRVVTIQMSINTADRHANRRALDSITPEMAIEAIRSLLGNRSQL